MKITIQNKVFLSKKTEGKEDAWSIEDALFLLKSDFFKNSIILGGDILTKELCYSYDNWFFNIDDRRDFQWNRVKSIATAIGYISDYIKKFGSDFHVVFVTQGNETGTH